MPHPFYPWERALLPILHEAGWALVPVWKDAENLAFTEFHTPNHPACSESLYQYVKYRMFVTSVWTDVLFSIW